MDLSFFNLFNYVKLQTINDVLMIFLFCVFQDNDKLIRLWIHEVYRVFYDRLIDPEDRQMFFNMVKETTSNCFKQSVDKV